ncbi:MAG: TetR/AcrR family transcriptional regulator [Mycobacteriaceae bacterium]|nr:TetR/AcrR family transcriptional regulator [Mycobacteriaceae bacterium]
MSQREQLKAERRRQLLDAGARLMSERGFRGVRLEDLGAAVGVSGPAVYRHFPSKEALLVELLSDVSERLLADASATVDRLAPEQALERLLDLHVDFALAHPHVIRLQDQDLHHLPADAEHRIRKTQRRYVEIWVETLCAVRPGRPDDDARTAAHAVFGLVNSTPHSDRGARTRSVLRRMALAALTS